MRNHGRLLTVAEAADALGLRTPTIRRWILKRTISFVKVGPRSVRITEQEIERIISIGVVPAVN